MHSDAAVKLRYLLPQCLDLTLGGGISSIFLFLFPQIQIFLAGLPAKRPAAQTTKNKEVKAEETIVLRFR